MKAALVMIGSIVLLVVSYILYQKSLGAIPFLLISFMLFYIVYRMMKNHEPEKEEKEKKKEENFK